MILNIFCILPQREKIGFVVGKKKKNLANYVISSHFQFQPSIILGLAETNDTTTNSDILNIIYILGHRISILPAS